MKTKFAKLLLFILIVFHQHLLAQTDTSSCFVFEDWKSMVDNKPTKKLFGIQPIKRSNKEIRLFGGNDFTVALLNTKVSRAQFEEETYAFYYDDTLYINGEKLNIQNHFCKVILQGNKIVFIGAASNKQMDYYDELTAFYAASGRNETSLIAEMHSKRFLYVLSLEKRKPQASLLDQSAMKKLLESNLPLFESYAAEKKPEEWATLLRYLGQLTISKC